MLRNVIHDPGPIVWKKLPYEKRDRDLGLGMWGDSMDQGNYNGPGNLKLKCEEFI